ncbi:MAG: hypothetical protein KDI15_13865, partial [Thiothrix sp.]|nr:hypothetical protein [Thiothrix sp.]
ELQMLLHQHPVNQARERQGQLPVNSLWLWGLNDPVYAPSRKGELPGTVALQQLAGGGFRGRILAAMAGIPWQADADITAVTGLSDGQAVPGAVLLACPELLPPLWRDAPEDWQQVLQSLDTKLFRELAQQRQAGRWQVKLHDGSGRVWDCGPVPFWRRWRRRAVFDFSRPPPPPRPDPEAWM